MKDKLRLVQAVLDAAKDVGGRKTLSCADAFRLAEENGFDLLQIGEVCNEHKVHITRCQLGCFN